MEKGKWNYIYDNNSVRENAKNVSSLMKNQNGNSSGSSTSSGANKKTSSWATSYLANKTKVTNLLASTSVSKSSAKTGKAAASKLVKTTTEPVYRAKTTTAKYLDNDSYKAEVDKLNTETKQKTEQNERQYRQAFEEEKENYRTKLMNNLSSKYAGNIPEEEVEKVNTKVEEYSKSLWKDVYEPQVKRVNTAIEEANKYIWRALKRKYESDNDIK